MSPSEYLEGPKVLRRDLWTDHRATAFSLMGKRAPPVFSQGEGFMHMGWWTSRILVTEIAQWARLNPGCQPELTDVSQWVAAVNTSQRPTEAIVIARTPMVLPLFVAKALKGGLVHELLHGLYSCKRYLLTGEVAGIVLPRWSKVPDWSRYTGMLLGWSNLIEDVRIEQRGCENFPGIKTRLMEVNDYVLEREKPCITAKPLTIVEATFRGLGKNYTSKWQSDSYDHYRQINPEAFAIVERGPLNPILMESRGLHVEDDLGAFRLALDVIELLANLAEEEAKETHGKPSCPKCGAPGKKLKVRHLSNGNGGKVQGKGVLTCTVCGHHEKIDLDESPQASTPLPPENEDLIQFEDVPQESPDEPPPGGSPDEPPPATPQEDESPEKAKPEAGVESGEPEPETEPTEPEPETEPTEPEPETEPETEGVESGEPEPTEAEPGEPETEGSPENETEVAGTGWGKLASNIMADPEENDLMDHQQILAEALIKASEAEDKDQEKGEKPWNPVTTGLDTVHVVTPSPLGQVADALRARMMLAKVQQEAAYLRAQFRMRFQDFHRRTNRHGMPSGRDISDRHLVETWGDLKSGSKARRAWMRPGKRLDVTIATAVVLDESTSMAGYANGTSGPQLWQVAMSGILAVVEPLSMLGCPTMVTGIRASSTVSTVDILRDALLDGHRGYGVTHDIFKAWDERFHQVLWRFANAKTKHSTPLCDGMQFALEELMARDETYRIMFVYTDGLPNPGNVPVMKWQFRIASKLGIHIVGVGIGEDAAYVQKVFPDFVYVTDLADLPVAMLAKLDEILSHTRRSDR